MRKLCALADRFTKLATSELPGWYGWEVVDSEQVGPYTVHMLKRSVRALPYGVGVMKDNNPISSASSLNRQYAEAYYRGVIAGLQVGSTGLSPEGFEYQEIQRGEEEKLRREREALGQLPPEEE